MQSFVINEKTVTVAVSRDAGGPFFDAECRGKHFRAAIAPRGQRLYLLLDREAVGVGLYSGDQEGIRELLEEYKEEEDGRDQNTDSES